MITPSRTPEGYPLRCSVCGFTQSVAPSLPPGDVPCANCGCLSWVESGPLSDRIMGESQRRIRRLAGEIGELGLRGEKPADVAAGLASRVVHCLAAYAAVVWRVSPANEFAPIGEMNFAAMSVLPPSYHGFRQQSADTVIQSNSAMWFGPTSEKTGFEANYNPSENVVIFAPIQRGDDENDSVLLEVLQRANGCESARNGYVKFVDQVCTCLGARYQFLD